MPRLGLSCPLGIELRRNSTNTGKVETSFLELWNRDVWIACIGSRRSAMVAVNQ
jgi:hypothetical protein